MPCADHLLEGFAVIIVSTVIIIQNGTGGAASLVRTVQVLFPNYFDSVESMFQRLARNMVNWVICTFSKLNPALASIVIYGFCMGVGFIIFFVTSLLDLAAGTHVLQALLMMDGLNERVLPALQLLNGLLAMLFGLSILLGRTNININVNINNRSRPNPNTMRSTLSSRSKVIRSLPKAKYGCLTKSDYSSSCSICLGYIEEDDGVRILPNCRHYFHISCIDRWLLPCTANNSACPLCRGTVIGLHT